MKKSRFTEVQVVQALQKHESGVSTSVLCREMGIAPATFYKWKSKYGGLEVSDVQKLRTLEEEHSRLKRMYADLAMDCATPHSSDQWLTNLSLLGSI